MRGAIIGALAVMGLFVFVVVGLLFSCVGAPTGVSADVELWHWSVVTRVDGEVLKSVWGTFCHIWKLDLPRH